MKAIKLLLMIIVLIAATTTTVYAAKSVLRDTLKPTMSDVYNNHLAGVTNNFISRRNRNKIAVADYVANNEDEKKLNQCKIYLQ
ncbi:ORF-28 [Catopsilia pomona nucleopolyhedrovirus]|uniref:ORF-28 n=1 Tax=Catopsilia pomona nucleopolyhedrovirus TaxID=1850906 RepID=A0A172WZ97_9ABAC|nr:ORF-28 [Catopsilia pomona nucleopolyhedrovirus]ANF29676.1 ORF-28 [Catopsilia pomona nucleopolyhedrovirus]